MGGESGLLGWEREEVGMRSLTGYETLWYYHPIQFQSIPQRKEGRTIIPILQTKKLRPEAGWREMVCYGSLDSKPAMLTLKPAHGLECWLQEAQGLVSYTEVTMGVRSLPLPRPGHPQEAL